MPHIKHTTNDTQMTTATPITSATDATHLATLQVKTIEFDFRCDDGTTASAEDQLDAHETATAEPIELYRYTQMGDDIDQDTLADVLIDEVSDLTDWSVTSLTIDWDRSDITVLSN